MVRAIGVLRRMLVLALLLTFSLTVPVVKGQAGPVMVPDVVGLSVPEAAALLNRNGLVLGVQLGEAWSEASGLPQNAVSAQSISPGEMVERGTAIDLTVLRTPNAQLLYDDNDLTLVNQTGQVLDLTGITFNVVEGTAASFPATRWADILRVGQCTQLWSVQRGSFKPLPECEFIQNWLITLDPAEHFWTGVNGVVRFSVLEDGIERAVCDAAPPGAEPLSCTFYLAAGSGRDAATEYVYFAYTPDRLIVRNASSDQWMPLGGLSITNYAPDVANTTFAFGDPAVFGSPATIGRIDQLAPGQCLLYTNSAPGTEMPPQDCDLIARLDLSPNVNFWMQAFDVNSLSDDQQHTCPAATEGRLTICIMPR